MKNCDCPGSNLLYLDLQLTLCSNELIVSSIVALYCVLEITVPIWSVFQKLPIFWSVFYTATLSLTLL